MACFDSEFDVGEKVRHYITKEKFVVRFVVFGSTGIAVYQCHPLYHVGKTNEVFTFDEPELEFLEEDN